MTGLITPSLQSLLITINYNGTQSIFRRTLLPTLPKTRPILVLVLRLISEWVNLITTDGQSASLSWYQAPVWGLWPDFYYCQTVAGLLIWGRPLWREHGSVFYNCCCLCQRSHIQVRVPQGSWPHFTVSDLRLPQPGGQGSCIYIRQELISDLRLDCLYSLETDP
jgi:hypothetical protein